MTCWKRLARLPPPRAAAGRRASLWPAWPCKASASLRSRPPLKTLMTTPELAALLLAMGCPREKSREMAAQLEKRAVQLARKKGGSQDEALLHLLNLIKQGWAAQQGGPSEQEPPRS